MQPTASVEKGQLTDRETQFIHRRGAEFAELRRVQEEHELFCIHSAQTPSTPFLCGEVFRFSPLDARGHRMNFTHRETQFIHRAGAEFAELRRVQEEPWRFDDGRIDSR